LGFCGYGDPVGIPTGFLWVWDGYGDRNSVPTTALVIELGADSLSVVASADQRLYRTGDGGSAAWRVLVVGGDIHLNYKPSGLRTSEQQIPKACSQHIY